MNIENAAHEAQLLIDLIDRDPGQFLCWEDAVPLVEALGGKLKVARDCQHGPTLFLYIAALMVRKDRSTK